MTMYPLPAAQPATFPAPSVASPFPNPALPPAYGIDPAEAASLEASPTLQPYVGVPTPLAYAPAGPQGYEQQMSAMRALTGGAISAENDPRGWTSEEAATQTTNAIARIAQTNPELAKDLAEQHGLETPEDGQGFWGTLMGGVGKLMEVTHLDDVLEVISRPAHILPEIIMDWGEEDVWKNVGDALSGHSDVSWDDVLVEKLGMERNIFTAALGLVGDIALDPLTYLPLGRLMSMGREVTSATAGKALATGVARESRAIVEAKALGATTEELVSKGFTTQAIAKADDVNTFVGLAMTEGARNVDEAALVGFAASDVATRAAAGARQGWRGTLERLGKGPKVLEEEASALSVKVQSGLKGVSDDALPGVAEAMTAAAAERGLKTLTGAADAAVTEAFRGNFARGASELAKKMGWNEKYAQAALKDWVKEGTGFLPGALGKAKYMRGKAAATQLGGWRFHLNIPVLGMRIAPRRVLPKLIPQLDFSIGRRFFSGISGEMRLKTLVRKGGQRELDAYAYFVENGFRKLEKEFPDIAKKVAGPGVLSRPGSILMSQSDMLGGLTAKFSPHAALMRNGGLGGLRTAQLARQAPALHELALRDMQTVLRADGETLLNGPQSAEFVTAAFKGVKDDAAKVTLSRNLERWAQLTGPEYGNGSVDDMLRKMPRGGLSDAEVTELRDLEAYFRAQGDDAYEAAQVLRQQAHLTEEVPAKAGVPSSSTAYALDFKDEMTPRDAARAAAESPHEYLHDAVYVTDGALLDGPIDESVLQDVRLPGGIVGRGVPVRRARSGLTGPTTGATQAELNKATRAVQRAEAELAETELVPAGLFVGDAGELEAKRVAATDALNKARAELHQLESPSQELVVSAKNIVDVDLRGGTGTTAGEVATNVPGDIATRLRALQQEAELTAKVMDEAAEAAMDPELAKLAKELRETAGNIPAGVTREMLGDGADGIRVLTKGPDGEDVEQLLLFQRPDTSIPVARINKDAAWDVGNRGTTIRSGTQAAYDAVSSGKAAKDLPGGSRVWLDRLIHETSDMPFEDAEATIRAELKRIGKDVPANQTVLEPDFIKSVAGTQQAKARAMVAQQFGKAARTLDRLGLTSSVANGGLVSLQRVRYAIGGSPSVVATMAEDVKAAVERNAKFLDEKLKPLAAQAKQAADRLADHNAAFDNVMAALPENTYGKLVGPRGTPVATAEAERALVVGRMQGKVTDLGNGVYGIPREDGGVALIMTSRDELSDALGHSPPIERLADEAGDGFTVVMHHTPNGRVESILRTGVKRSEKGVEPGTKGGGVFAYTLERGATIAPGQTAIAIRVPTASIRAGKEAGTISADIAHLDVENIVGTYQAEQIIGTRTIDGAGKVIEASDSGPARRLLLQADWDLHGVSSAPDPVVAAAERIKAAGVSGELERKAVQQGHDSIEGALHQAVSDAQRAFGKANMEQTAAIGEVERLATLMKTEAAQVRPALFPASDIARTEAGFERLGIPGFEEMMMPTFMAQEFKRAINGFKGLDGVHAEFRKFNSWWKSHATWMWPSFHIRNMYGAYFNNLLGGVDIKDYIFAGRVRRAAREFEEHGAARKWGDKLLKDGGDGDMLEVMRMNGQTTMMGKSIDELTYGDVADMTASMGVVSSNGQPLLDARLSASETERGGQVWVEKHALVKPYATFAKGVGTGTENVMRTAAFARGMKTFGTAPEARAFTMMRHGDYADLTDFEYGVVRDVIPFYKWMRTNTPFQVHQLLESPAKLLAVGKAQNAAYVAAGVDPDEQKYKMPKWMGESFNIPFGKADANGMFDMVSLDLPMSDLHKTATDYFTSALPLFQPFLEKFVVKQDLFTGAPVTDKRIPLTGVWTLPGISDLLKVTKFAEEGPDGTLYTTDTKRNFMAVIPEFTKFQSWLFADPDRTQSRFGAFTSAMVALPLRAADDQALTAAELDFYYSTVEPEMSHLREMGYPLPTVDQLDATFGDVNQALALQGIVPRPLPQPTLGLAA